MDSKKVLSGKLEVCQDDLLDYHNIFGNINGCSRVFHIPEPYTLNSNPWAPILHLHGRLSYRDNVEDKLFYPKS
jgi:hypothetical protein